MPHKVFLKILAIWWPLALSWLFMGLEQPLIGAVIARLPDPTIHLAALGIVFPLALLIESPIIMLLAASTALSDHKQAYRLMFRFMMVVCGLLTLFHALLVVPPIYDVLVVQTFKPPPEIIEPARLGLLVLLPWTWSIGYRRFHQGVLIRYGASRAVSIGTLLRLLGNIVGMGVAFLLDQPGIVVGNVGISVGVLTEAVYIGWRARPLVRDKLKDVVPQKEYLTWGQFANFYAPLAVTSLVLLGAQPLGSAALTRMPNPLVSLAVWPILGSFVFLFRGLGFAYNEVVVSVLKERMATFAELRRFANILSLALTALLVIIAFTPLSLFYFGGVAGLEPTLASLAVSAFVFCILWPAISTYRNLYQGVIVARGQTRHVTESVVVSLGVSAMLLFIGVALERFSGIYVAVAAFLIGNMAQVLWLMWRARPVLERLRAEEPKLATPEALLTLKP